MSFAKFKRLRRGGALDFDSITMSDGELGRGNCFERLGWEFEDWQCYSKETAEAAVLQQFKKKSGRWETVKTDIADNLSCSEGDGGGADLAFSRKASTPGVKDYRTLFANGSWYEIIVTVHSLRVVALCKSLPVGGRQADGHP